MADWLEWSPEAVTLDNENSTDDDSKIPPLQRNATTGVLSGGGVSLQYISSLGLLLHAYQSGHSVASAIGISGLTAPSEPHLRITHSFLLATGRKRSKNGPVCAVQQSQQQPLCIFGPASPAKLMTSLLFAARSACNPASSSKTPIPDTSQMPTARQHSQKRILPVGPLVQWSEVLGGHPGLVSAMSLSASSASSEKISVTDGTLSSNITLLLAFEPDQVWIQPIQPKLTSVTSVIDQKISKSSSGTDVASEPKTPTNQPTRQADTTTTSTSLSVLPAVVASVSIYWNGHMSLLPRTITYLFTSDGQLLVQSTCPRSVSQLINSNTDASQPAPGQFWLQSHLLRDTFGCPDSAFAIWNSACASYRGALDSHAWSFCLPQGSLWDLALSSNVERHKPVIQRTTEQTNPLMRTKSLYKYLVDSPYSGPPPLDLFEHVSPTVEIEFGGADLLQLYNRDQLRRRLLTLGSPVTGAGSSVMARMNRQGALQTTPGWAFSPWEPGTSASTTTTTSMTTNAPGTPSSDIAFVIEVYNRKPGESVFNRVIPVTPPGPGAQYRFVDIPLYRSEMSLSSHLLQIFVGHSSDPEGLTSVDLVTVYTAPISDVDWRRGHRTRLSGRNSPISFSWPRSRRSGSLEWTAQTTCEFPLGCVHDMFNLEMHSNKRELNVCSSTCYRTPSFSLTGVRLLLSKLEQVLQHGAEFAQCSAKMLDKLNFRILQSQATRVLNYLFLTAAGTDKGVHISISPQEVALQQHALDLLLITTRVGCEAQSFSAERLKSVLDQVVSETVSLALIPVRNSFADEEIKCSTQLLTQTQRLARLVYSIALCDPLHFSSLIMKFRLLDFFESALEKYQRLFPPTSNAQGIFSPLWTKNLAATCSLENQIKSDGCVTDMRNFITALVRGLFAISLNKFQSNDLSAADQSCIENHKEEDFLYRLLTNKNLASFFSANEQAIKFCRSRNVLKIFKIKY
ncbi:E3 ubiquitin-protein ligase UBR4 [Fasciolopsis buskii]|uniref:E3 ubiquitin-protein ligase UBR4 n=1 Tax=Fasciolopsis buskii TaxID=27845 RepID=A0A8E0VEF1_9TREM|nr:E3 ubiquitin-protein ligase UBR4 [Fasciolopsis buski]